MTLKTAFYELRRSMHSLGDELLALQITIREDRPLVSDSALVDIYGDGADDMLGWLNEADSAALGVDEQGDLHSTWQALTIIHEQVGRLRTHFYDLVSYDRLAPLIRFGRERGGEWHAWTRSVKHGLARCQDPLSDVERALFECWQEIAERAGMTSVSVQTTNIGQQITAPESREMTPSGVT